MFSYSLSPLSIELNETKQVFLFKDKNNINAELRVGLLIS